MRDEFAFAETYLSDLVASRLCHDLVNPLGAIGNGVELLEMTGKADGAEVELIRDAVQAAQARIRLFRLAFGGAGPDALTSQREARTAVEQYFAQSRITAQWTAEREQPRRATKMAFLMLLCAEAALPMGGTITIGPDAQGRWELQATGPRLNVDEAVWSVLRFGRSSLNREMRASEVQFAVLHRTAEALGHTLNFVVDDVRLTLSTA